MLNFSAEYEVALKCLKHFFIAEVDLYYICNEKQSGMSLFVFTTEMFPFIISLGNGEGNENTLKSRDSRKERATTSYKVSSLGFSSKLAI